MSLALDLLTSISKNPGITAQELADELKQDLARVRPALHQAKWQKWVTTKRDDVTRQPGYHLTPEGKAKLKAGAGTQADAPQPAADTPMTHAAEPTAAGAPASPDVSATAALQARLDNMQHELTLMHAENVRLQAQLRAAETSRHAPAATVATHAPAGYLITAPKRAPRRFTSDATARATALKAVRAGAARADVFALIPVGTARRGAEWTDPKEH